MIRGNLGAKVGRLTVWADAICDDQSNPVERSEQVMLMNRSDTCLAPQQMRQEYTSIWGVHVPSPYPHYPAATRTRPSCAPEQFHFCRTRRIDLGLRLNVGDAVTAAGGHPLRDISHAKSHLIEPS